MKRSVVRTINLLGRGVALPSGPIRAPERVCLWEPGPVIGDFGVNVWDADAARSVMAAYEGRGNPIPIDIEHNSNRNANPAYDANNPPEGGGYTGLKLDARGALWLDPIQWSARARREIESGSRRSISPDWTYDPETGRPVSLNAISLVQNPGTYGIGLMASAGADGEKAMDLTFIIAALKAAAASGDMEQVSTLITELEKAAGGGTGEPPMAGADQDPMKDPALAAMPPDLQKQCAAAIAKYLASSKAGATQATAAAAGHRPDPQKLLADARAAGAAGYREEREKDRLIAAAGGRPGMNDALAAELGALPLATVKKIVEALPEKQTAAATAGATASAAVAETQGVKTGPLAGHEQPSAQAGAGGQGAARRLTAGEEHSIAMINATGTPLHERIAQEAKLAEEARARGEGRFSALGQLAPRQAPAKAN